VDGGAFSLEAVRERHGHRTLTSSVIPCRENCRDLFTDAAGVVGIYHAAQLCSTWLVSVERTRVNSTMRVKTGVALLSVGRFQGSQLGRSVPKCSFSSYTGCIPQSTVPSKCDPSRHSCGGTDPSHVQALHSNPFRECCSEQGQRSKS